MRGYEVGGESNSRAFKRKVEYKFGSLRVRDDAEVDDPCEPWRRVARAIRREFPRAYAWLETPHAGKPGLSVAPIESARELMGPEMETIDRAWKAGTAGLCQDDPTLEGAGMPWLLELGVKDHGELDGMDDEALSSMAYLVGQAQAFILSDYGAFERGTSHDALEELRTEWCRLACLDWRINHVESGRRRDERCTSGNARYGAAPEER